MVLETIEDIQNITQDILEKINNRGAIPVDHTRLTQKLRTLQVELKSLLDSKEELYDMVPVFTMRQWAFASIRQSLRKISLAKQFQELSSDDEFFHEATTAALWAYQGTSILRLRSILQEICDDMDRFIFDRQTLRQGDVVLSYKTEAYLKKDILARLVAFTTGSSVTHSYITAESGITAKLLCSSPDLSGVSLLSALPQQGEIYIVMRLKDTDAPYVKHIEESIEIWKRRIESRLPCKFSESKSWVASALGFIYCLSVYIFQKPIIIKNFAKNRPGLFCSEVVDNIFKEAGIFVTPRSEHPALIGPVEFFHSPYLALQGFIINDEDRETIKAELIDQFNLETV